jgi:hypothetical protein
MKLDFNDIIEKRKQALNIRKEELDNLKDQIILSNPIEFSISEIQVLNPKNKSEKVGIKILNNLENIKGSVIYIFEIVDTKIKSELLESVTKYRSKENKDEYGNDLRRSTAKISKNAKLNTSDVLYVGSVEKHIHLRIKQHLGFGHPQTFALQLKHWAKNDWRFKFYYIEINNNMILTDIEAQISNELNPLLGKREK